MCDEINSVICWCNDRMYEIASNVLDSFTLRTTYPRSERVGDSTVWTTKKIPLHLSGLFLTLIKSHTVLELVQWSFLPGSEWLGNPGRYHLVILPSRYMALCLLGPGSRGEWRNFLTVSLWKWNTSFPLPAAPFARIRHRVLPNYDSPGTQEEERSLLGGLRCRWSLIY